MSFNMMRQQIQTCNYVHLRVFPLNLLKKILLKLVFSGVDVWIGRKNHSSIPTTTIGRGLKQLNSKATPNQIRRSSGPDTGSVNQKNNLKVVIYEARTLLGLGVSVSDTCPCPTRVCVRHRHDTYNYTELYHFFQIIIGVAVSVSYLVSVSVSVLRRLLCKYNIFFFTIP
jgi:hypothetical protein